MGIKENIKRVLFRIPKMYTEKTRIGMYLLFKYTIK